MEEVMLDIRDVHAGYGAKDVLQGVSLSLCRGEFAALIGTNGAGKSTLLKCISGLLPVQSGEIVICGRNTQDMKAKERARMVAVVPQS